jgi:hypothetical protein
MYSLDDKVIGRQNPLDRGNCVPAAVDIKQHHISKLVPNLKVMTSTYQEEQASIVAEASCIEKAFILFDYLFFTSQQHSNCSSQQVLIFIDGNHVTDGVIWREGFIFYLL